MAGRSGLQMLLSSLGVDIAPEQIIGIITQLQQTVVSVDQRLSRIEQKLDSILNRDGPIGQSRLTFVGNPVGPGDKIDAAGRANHSTT